MHQIAGAPPPGDTETAASCQSGAMILLLLVLAAITGLAMAVATLVSALTTIVVPRGGLVRSIRRGVTTRAGRTTTPC